MYPLHLMFKLTTGHSFHIPKVSSREYDKMKNQETNKLHILLLQLCTLELFWDENLKQHSRRLNEANKAFFQDKCINFFHW